MVAIFQWGWGSDAIGLGATGPIESFLPVMLLAILFGLSMDYQVFLVSRIHEEWLRTGDNSRAVVRRPGGHRPRDHRRRGDHGLRLLAVRARGARPIGEFGLGLAAAILLDALVLRTVLVPGGDAPPRPRNWWLPSSLTGPYHTSISTQPSSTTTNPRRPNQSQWTETPRPHGSANSKSPPKMDTTEVGATPSGAIPGSVTGWRSVAGTRSEARTGFVTAFMDQQVPVANRRILAVVATLPCSSWSPAGVRVGLWGSAAGLVRAVCPRVKGAARPFGTGLWPTLDPRVPAALGQGGLGRAVALPRLRAHRLTLPALAAGYAAGSSSWPISSSGLR